MVSDGLLNKQIAYELAISESTVKQHVSGIESLVLLTEPRLASRSNAMHLS